LEENNAVYLSSSAIRYSNAVQIIDNELTSSMLLINVIN